MCHASPIHPTLLRESAADGRPHDSGARDAVREEAPRPHREHRASQTSLTPFSSFSCRCRLRAEQVSLLLFPLLPLNLMWLVSSPTWVEFSNSIEPFLRDRVVFVLCPGTERFVPPNLRCSRPSSFLCQFWSFLGPLTINVGF